MRTDRVIVVMAFLALSCGLSMMGTWADDVDGADDELTYIGIAKCRMCHPEQAKAWEKTPHKRSFSWLKISDRPSWLPHFFTSPFSTK